MAWCYSVCAASSRHSWSYMHRAYHACERFRVFSGLDNEKTAPPERETNWAPSDAQHNERITPFTGCLGCGWHGALFCQSLPALSEDHSKVRLCSKSELLDKPHWLLSCCQWGCKCYLEALPSLVGNLRVLTSLALGQGHALCLDYNTLEKQLLACNGALIRDWLTTEHQAAVSPHIMAFI